MQCQLFSTDFLLHGILETEAWKSVSDLELDSFVGQLKAHYAPFTADSALNDGQTEDGLIEPVLMEVVRRQPFPYALAQKID